MSAPPLVLLVGVDGSPPSLRALLYALRLAAETECELHVCNVQPAMTYAGYLVTDPQTVADHLSGAPGHALLTEAVGLVEEHGAHAEWDVLHGEPGRELAAHAERVRADLLLLGTRGRNAAAEMLLGSVAHAVLEQAPCPVVIAR